MHLEQTLFWEMTNFSISPSQFVIDHQILTEKRHPTANILGKNSIPLRKGGLYRGNAEKKNHTVMVMERYTKQKEKERLAEESKFMTKNQVNQLKTSSDFSIGKSPTIAQNLMKNQFHHHTFGRNIIISVSSRREILKKNTNIFTKMIETENRKNLLYC